jgi:quinol monooxygenase YgiN
MAQTSLFVKMVAQPGKRDEVVAALETMLPQVAQEEGTLVYSFHLDAGDENTVWVFELYTDGDALAAHGGSDAMKSCFGTLGPLFAEPPMMVMATPTAGAKGLPS